MRRLRISFSKSKHRKVEKLAKYNRDLNDLLGWSDNVLPMREHRKVSEPVAFYEKIRQQCTDLHTALKGSWRCVCQKPHQANVLLAKRKPSSITLDVDVLFIIEAHAPNGQHLSMWQNVIATVKPAIPASAPQPSVLHVDALDDIT